VITASLLSAALGLLLAAPAAASSSDLSVALGRLAAEDVAGAAAIIEPASVARAGEPGVTLALGALRFYQQRYDEAVRLLEAGAPGGSPTNADPTGLLRLARAASALAAGQDVAEGTHFTIAYPKGKDAVLVPYLLEALEAQRAALEQDLGVAPPEKVRVEVLGSVSDLARLSTLTDAEIRASGTIALCKYGKLMLVSPKALFTGYDWLDTAAHEYVHYAVMRKGGPATPIWLHEGLAKWLETRWRGAGGQAFSPFSAALVRRAAEQGKLVTFEQMHPSMAKLPSQEQAALAFAEVVLAVELMVEKGGTAALARLLERVAGGTPVDAAVAVTLGQPWPDFLAAWKRHLATRPLPRGGAQALNRLKFIDDPKQGGPWAEWAELEDPKAREHARLGELMRERGRAVAARIEYQKALDRGGARVAVLANQFAVVAIQTGKQAEAARVLAESINWNPDHAALRVRLGKLELARQNWAGAREQLTLANRQDPFDPEIHAGLALALEPLGDPGGASRERRFAEILTQQHAQQQTQQRGHQTP
jgi:tetratricopeptide (TPR) repeat protein